MYISSLCIFQVYVYFKFMYISSLCIFQVYVYFKFMYISSLYNTYIKLYQIYTNELVY